MNRPTTPDGVLGLHPNGGNQLSINYDTSSLGQELTERVLSGDPRIRQLGRSFLGQLGVDLVPSTGRPVEENGRLILPVQFESYTRIGDALVDDIMNITSDKAVVPGQTLTHNGRELPIGRLMDTRSLKPLAAPEVQNAINEKLIYFDPTYEGTDEEPLPYRINEDGSIDMKLGLVEFNLNQRQFMRSPENRLRLFRDSRAGLTRHLDHSEKQPGELLPQFLLGGIACSTGPFYWEIRNDEKSSVKQLESAAIFDGNRLMGVGSHLPHYDRHRQVELVNTGNNQQTFGDTRINVKLSRTTHRDMSDNPATEWWKMNEDDRVMRHLRGITALEALGATDPTKREALLGLAKEKNSSIIMTRLGAGLVENDPSSKFHLANLKAVLSGAEAFNLEGLSADEVEMLGEFVDNIGSSGERSSVIIADTIDLEHLPRLVNAGVRAFLFNNYRQSPDDMRAMTKAEITMLSGLSRDGIGIAWAREKETHEGGGTDLREFHPSGLWVKPESIKRVEQLEFVVAMYGSHNKSAGDALSGEVDRFISQFPDSLDIDPYKMAIAHGNGDGIMYEAHKAALKHKMLSIGVSIDFEHLGQSGTNWEPQAIALQVSGDRLNRQQMLDVFNTVSIFNRGGLGTAEEIAITLCSQKLNEGLPVPKILIQSDEKLYESFDTYIQTVCDEGLAPAWVANTVHVVNSYDEALEVLTNFTKSPEAYWVKSGISRKDFETALNKQIKTHKEIGFNPDTKLARKAARYLRQKIA